MPLLILVEVRSIPAMTCGLHGRLAGQGHNL